MSLRDIIDAHFNLPGKRIPPPLPKKTYFPAPEIKTSKNLNIHNMIPVLMITCNRLEYTKQAIKALMKLDKQVDIYIIDNGSIDGTVNWLSEACINLLCTVIRLPENIGIAGAMNLFLNYTQYAQYVAKVDNDTIVPENFIDKMLPHMMKADIVQAKHPLLKETHAAGFDDWVKNMRADGPLRFNHFVGGSGILFKRDIVKKVPNTEWIIGGWRQWQRENPQYKKAFATDIEIKLLDTDENGADYSKYPEYYKSTRRVK